MQTSLLQGQKWDEKAGLRTPSSIVFPILRGRRNKEMDRIKEEKMEQGKKSKLEERKMVQRERGKEENWGCGFEVFANLKSKPEIREDRVL